MNHQKSRTPNTNVNGVKMNVESDSTNKNHKHNFYFTAMSLRYSHKWEKLLSGIDQMEPLNSHELLETGV